MFGLLKAFQYVFLGLLSWTTLGLGAALVFLRRGSIRRARAAILLVAAIVLIPALPIVAHYLRGPLETAIPSLPLDDYPTSDAILVLGGSVAGRLPPREEAEEVAGTRVLTAARLFKRRKAKFVLVSGGGEVYSDKKGQLRTDADDMAEILVDMGVPPEAIVKESKSRNTRENVIYSAIVLREKKLNSVLLVTSASHARRASRLFVRQRIPFVTVPAGREWTQMTLSLADFWPTHHALSSSAISLREYAGLWFDFR